MTDDLARKQAELAAALVAAAPPPPGFDPVRLAAARTALLNKRAGDVSRAWPALAATLGPQWRDRFAAWAGKRPPNGPLRDGFDFARHLAAAGELPDGDAARELAAREGFWRYDGAGPPVPRRLPAFARRLVGKLRLHRLTRRR